MKNRNTETKPSKTKDITLIAMFVALMIAGAFIKIPLPVVPLTFQAQFAILSGLVLGSRRGSLAVSLYVLFGLIGLPIFSMGGGIHYVFMPTFGYILGFILAALVSGKLSEGLSEWSFVKVYFVSLAGLVVIFASGMIYFYMMKTMYMGETLELKKFFMSFLIIPLPVGLAKTALFAEVARRLKPLA